MTKAKWLTLSGKVFLTAIAMFAFILGAYTLVADTLVIARGGSEARLERALQSARKAAVLTGYPSPGWPNPYKKVLRILRVDRAGIPPARQAEALTLYAGFIGNLNPFGGKPHSHAWYRKKEQSILLRAVKICPGCPAPWVALALMHEAALASRRRHIFNEYLAGALRADPNDRYANYLRAQEIFSAHGGHRWRSGVIFHGDAGFVSKKWIQVFCYRSSIALERPARENSTFAIRFEQFPYDMFFDKLFLKLALKHYAPRQYAELQAGTWKPGHCPDPFPPPVKKSSIAKTKPAATQGGK